MIDCDYYNINFILTSLYFTLIKIYHHGNCEICNLRGGEGSKVCTNDVNCY